MPQFAEHAAFIWSAYGIAALLLGGVVVATIVRARAAKAKLERLERQAKEDEG
ncbi:MAG: heme exporter protein CcmD [Pseudomonadota bacterium]